jgi:hypothetical protein
LYPIIATLAFALCFGTAGAQGPAPEADGARVTISAVDRPLDEVLTALSQQIGRPIVFRNVGAIQIRASGQGIPFQAAIRPILRGYNLVAAWNGDTFYVAAPQQDLERLKATPTPEVVKAFGEVYGPLLAAGPGTYLPETQRDALVGSIETTLRALIEQPGDPELPGRLLDAVAPTGEARLTAVVAGPVLKARLDKSDWAGAAAIWRRAYPQGASGDAVGVGWQIVAGMATTGDSAGAKTFLTEANLTGDGWVAALREQLGTPAAPEKAEAVASAYRLLLNGRAATAGQTELGRDLVAALVRRAKVEPALQLWKTALLPAAVDGTTIDATLHLFQGLLVAGGPKQAMPVWQQWYQWNRIRPAFEVDGRPALDDNHFALLKRVYSVAWALGTPPAELSDFMRKVRTLRPRTLRIMAAVDRRIQDDPAWKEKTINRVDFASKVFEKTYGLKLEVVDFQFWVPRDETGPNGAVEQLKARRAKSKTDFIIGFILHIYPASAQAAAMARAAQIVGYASPEFGGTMMLRDMAFVDAGSVGFFSPEVVNETATHELGHAFGALHTDDKTSVMRQGFGSEPAYHFDRFNARVNLYFKEYDFSKGFDQFDEGELRELAAAYQGLQGKCKQGNGAEEREAKMRFTLAKRLKAQNRTGEAIVQFGRVVKIGEPKDLVKQARAELTKLQGGRPAPASPRRRSSPMAAGAGR